MSIRQKEQIKYFLLFERPTSDADGFEFRLVRVSQGQPATRPDDSWRLVTTFEFSTQKEVEGWIRIDHPLIVRPRFV